MRKTIEQVRQEIQDGRKIEHSYKGKINYGLYLIAMSSSGQEIMKISWFKESVKQFEEFINIAEANPVIEKVMITNRYDDWKVIAYSNV